MKRINYEQRISNIRKRKVDELHESKPYLSLPYNQRQWLRTYYQLKAVWEYLGFKKEYPKLPNGMIRSPEPWKDKHHSINRKLDEARRLVESIYPEWRRFKNYRVEYKFIDDLNEV